MSVLQLAVRSNYRIPVSCVATVQTRADRHCKYGSSDDKEHIHASLWGAATAIFYFVERRAAGSDGKSRAPPSQRLNLKSIRLHDRYIRNRAEDKTITPAKYRKGKKYPS